MSLSMINFVLSITILQNWNKFHPEVTELFRYLLRKYDRHTDARTLTITLPWNTFHLLYVVMNLLIVCNIFHLYMLW